MVRNVTAFGRSGLSDWVIQRVSAVVLGVYFVGLLAYIVMTPGLDYAQWQALFGTTWMRVASLAALLSLCAHAWIGMWTVITDYFSEHLMGSKGTALRVVFQAATVLLIFVYLVWGVQILWGL
jgi:succinate dehydrogenase / fumarate reductase, membrane anchor subunit